MTEEDVLRVLEDRYSVYHPQVTSIVLNKKRGVWKVRLGHREYAMKHFRFETGFSIWLNELLARRGVSPSIRKTADGELFAIDNGVCFYLTKWMAGTITQNSSEYIRAVANFHKNAHIVGRHIGYIEPVYGPNTKEKWLRIYRKKLVMLEAWSKEAEGKSLKKALTSMISVGERMLGELDSMELGSYINKAIDQKTVVHWDMHRGNIIFFHSRPTVLDLDSATISFQVCDLHQVVSDLMEKMAVLPENLDRIVKEYFSVYPDSQNYQPIYFTVCRFPHYFWTMAERMVVYSGGINANPEQLCSLSLIEKRKSEHIQLWAR